MTFVDVLAGIGLICAIAGLVLIAGVEFNSLESELGTIVSELGVIVFMGGVVVMAGVCLCVVFTSVFLMP